MNGVFEVLGGQAPGNTKNFFSGVFMMKKMEKERKKWAGVKMAFLPAIFLGLLMWTGAAWAADYNPLPDTGQTKCYDEEGNEINPCPAPGDDFYGQDANYQGLQPSFTKHINFNGTGDDVTVDNNTKLMWMTGTADTDGDGDIDGDDKVAWQDAVDYCDDLVYAGFDDWYLPDIFMLLTIVNYGTYSPAIDTTVFDCELSNYWSSTTGAYNADHAWDVHFRNGYDNCFIKTNYYYVRCVRDGS